MTDLTHLELGKLPGQSYRYKLQTSSIVFTAALLVSSLAESYLKASPFPSSRLHAQHSFQKVIMT
jgi:hypothetical protein